MTEKQNSTKPAVSTSVSALYAVCMNGEGRAGAWRAWPCRVWQQRVHAVIPCACSWRKWTTGHWIPRTFAYHLPWPPARGSWPLLTPSTPHHHGNDPGTGEGEALLWTTLKIVETLSSVVDIKQNQASQRKKRCTDTPLLGNSAFLSKILALNRLSHYLCFVQKVKVADRQSLFLLPFSSTTHFLFLQFHPDYIVFKSDWLLLPVKYEKAFFICS